ncbi:hypothetical protein [Devosia sp.]|uniref:hypothetical protein n=1 Tax=Devosia sp. TaxID=1871048 RepID=UPI001B2E4061|nr:hypothetical protein [Devosia sp.]MBO9587549.1 hypothetical protein [Devosia sp.]
MTTPVHINKDGKFHVDMSDGTKVDTEHEASARSAARASDLDATAKALEKKRQPPEHSSDNDSDATPKPFGR